MRPFVALHVPSNGGTVILGVCSDSEIIASVASSILRRLKEGETRINDLTAPSLTQTPFEEPAAENRG